MDKKEKAINRALQVFQEFMRNKKGIFKEVRNPKGVNLLYLLSSIKALCRYAKSLYLQLGHNYEAGRFYYREKIVERFIRSHWGIQHKTDYELCNEHGALFLSSTFYIGNHLSEINGKFKRLKFRLKIMTDLILNWLSYLLLGYGERPWNTVIAMIGFILIFAGIYLSFYVFITVGDVNFGDCLYYSFITFFTLGFGNINPVDAIYARLLVSIEGFIGIILIALFILTLSRKIIR